MDYTRCKLAFNNRPIVEYDSARVREDIPAIMAQKNYAKNQTTTQNYNNNNTISEVTICILCVCVFDDCNCQDKKEEKIYFEVCMLRGIGLFLSLALTSHSRFRINFVVRPDLTISNIHSLRTYDAIKLAAAEFVCVR